MSVKVVYESEACDCCLLWVANNDDSSCRDYYGHKHRHAKVSKRVIRQIAEEYPGATGLSIVPAYDPEDDGDNSVEMVGCEFCGQSACYMYGYPVAVLASVPGAHNV